MRQKRYRRLLTATILMCAIALTALSAQDAAIDPDQITGVANTDFREVSVELFEDPTLWTAYISRDDGYSIHQRFAGGPSAKNVLTSAERGGKDDANVLGVKTEFIRRGFTEIVFRPLRPIPIPGLVNEISVWVAGRELPHDLYLLVRDIDGRIRRVFVDRLSFRGWQQVRAQIPAYNRLSDGLYTGVKQYDPRRPLDTGLELVALVIEPRFTEAYGTYYVYFDDMRASTDLSPISLRDPDDIVDAW